MKLPSFLFILAIPAVALAADPKYAGDVVGRDLSLAVVGALGHVGIYTGSSVLEVMNSTSPVQKNSLSTFKKASKFWGAKYVSSSNKSYNFQSVIDKGWDQRNYTPSYTTSASYTVGSKSTQWVYNSARKKWELKTVIVPAKFRCDTFVYYSFDAGIGVKLAGSYITPKIVYDNCKNSR